MSRATTIILIDIEGYKFVSYVTSALKQFILFLHMVINSIIYIFTIKKYYISVNIFNAPEVIKCQYMKRSENSKRN